jgi:hypothetical protein
MRHLLSLLLLTSCVETALKGIDDEEDAGPDDTAQQDTDPDTALDDTGCGSQQWYADADGDGFGDPEVTQDACEQPSGFVEAPNDCDDGDAAVNPSADELCNDIDDDCNGEVDDDPIDATDWYGDSDADGYGDPDQTGTACDPPSDSTDNPDDCDDAEDTVYPGAEELCDGLDNDCDGEIDGEQCECVYSAPAGLAVTIVDSGSYAMDDIWETKVRDLGHVPSVISQSALSSTGFHATTDVLIVSSGVDNIPAAAVSSIQTYVQGGGVAYVQSEYLTTFGGNIAFAQLVNGLGGSFAWSSSVSGDLQPMTVGTCIGETPTLLGTLSYHWYGCAGTISGAGSAPFMTWSGQDIAFHFCSPVAGEGAIITTSDQDWVNQSGSDPEAQLLLENILTALAAHPQSCP